MLSFEISSINMIVIGIDEKEFKNNCSHATRDILEDVFQETVSVNVKEYSLVGFLVYNVNKMEEQAQ